MLSGDRPFAPLPPRAHIALGGGDDFGEDRDRVHAVDQKSLHQGSGGTCVVVGGPALGYDDVRAKALGATAWAPDAQGAVTAMATVPDVVAPAPPLPAAPADEQADLEHDHRRIVATLRTGWSLTSGPLAVPQIAADVLNQLLHAVSAVLLTGDPRPVTETAYWIVDLMATRGIDVAVVDELRTRAVVALADYPLARDIVATHFAVSP